MRRCSPDSSSIHVRAIAASVGVALGACAATALARDARLSSPGADLPGQWLALSCAPAGADGAHATLDTGFESLQPLPAELVGQLDVVTWGGAAAGVTGRSVFVAPTAPLAVPRCGVVDDPVGGNTSRKLRGYTGVPAFGSNTFYGRWARMDLMRTNGAGPGQPGERFVFYPQADRPLRIEHDMFVTSTDSVWASSPTCLARGVIASQLEVGPRPQASGAQFPPSFVVYFGTLLGRLSSVEPVRPPGDPRAGEPYAIPVGQWFRVTHEFDALGGVRYLIDYNDGAGPVEIFRGRAIVPWGRVDRLAFTGDFAFDGDACFIDNLHIDGGDAPPFPHCPGDVDYDRLVTFVDLNIVLGQFGEIGPNLTGDSDRDGDVDFADLNVVLGAYGTACPATS